MKVIKKIQKNKRLLNAKQEHFCKCYATSREFFGNGVESYIEAYGSDRNDPKWYNTARANASRLLTNANIYTRITELLDATGFNDVTMDKHLLFVASQFDDLPSKVRAIAEYNKLKQRIVTKAEIKHEGLSLKDLYDASQGDTK